MARKNNKCNQNLHTFEEIGRWAGLSRTRCSNCELVQIDLTSERAVSTVSVRLRATLDRITDGGGGLDLDLRPAALFGQAR